MTKKKKIDIDWEKHWHQQAVLTWMRMGMLEEAKASVALDREYGIHTCHNECTEYNQCPGNKEKE